MKIFCYLLPMLLLGCASNSGIVPTGDDTHIVSRQAATGFSGLGTLKADALQEANQYCLSQKKNLHVISATESKPPFIFGNFPKADVRFRCVDVATDNNDNVSTDANIKDETPKDKDVYTQLEKLDDLRKRGILTQAEFEAEKKKLLDGN